jgi:hypothetical protein
MIWMRRTPASKSFEIVKNWWSLGIYHNPLLPPFQKTICYVSGPNSSYASRVMEFDLCPYDVPHVSAQPRKIRLYLEPVCYFY